MRIWHHVSLDPEAEEVLQERGLEYKRDHSVNYPHRDDFVPKVNSLILDIAEDHPAYMEIKRMVEAGKKLNMVHTEFTEQEILSAEWLLAWPAHSIGYSLPRGDAWSTRYFECDCIHCGVSWRQIAPFRISKEPSMRRASFASFWGGFELFCTGEVAETLASEKLRGYETWPVLLNKTRQPVTNIKQLIIQQITQPSLVEELAEQNGVRKHMCAECGQVWYNPYVRGMIPLRRDALRQDIDFQLTHEWIGFGRTARREILVSQRVAHLVLSRKWKGLYLSPVQLV